MFLVRCALLVSVAVAVTASDRALEVQDVGFHLFTRSNPGQSQPLLPTLNSIMMSSFDVTKPTIITIHNFGQSVASNFNAFVVNAHLDAEEVNVLAIDWSRGSGMYTQGLSEATRCGQHIATFMNILIETFSYPADNIRIVGQGLGGHVAGIAARQIVGTVPHVVALDPSFHGWTHHPDRLSTDAATVVEVLHTTAGIMGYDRPLGHLDFYPNGGVHQNGCLTDTDCSHRLAYTFYAESLSSGPRFVGTRCTNLEQALTMQCSGTRDAVFGGFESKQGITGIFTFQTNVFQPHARD